MAPADGSLDRSTRPARHLDRNDACGPRRAADRRRGSRRRTVVRQLRSTEHSLTVRSLARRVAEREHEPTFETTLLERCQRIYDALTNTHLPALEADGLLEYDARTGVVRPEGAPP